MGNQILYYEAGRTKVDMAQLTDQGDHLDFRSSSLQYISRYATDAADYGPTVRPDGALAGGNGSPGTANDTVDVTALSAYLAGIWYGTGGDSAAIAAATVTITRGTVTTNPYKINSVTLASSGALAVVEGAGHTDFSATTRGSAGAPPVIPLKSIELFQVRTTTSTAAPITAAEIFSVPGTHREEAFYPQYTIKYANVISNSLDYAGVVMTSALPTIHTGGVTKGIWLEGYEASFTEWTDARNFQAPGTSGSLTSETFYQRALGSVDESLGEGSFEWGCSNPVTDSQLSARKKFTWLRYKPNKLQSPMIVVQGKIYGETPNPSTGVNVASMAVIAESEAERVF